MEIVIGVIVLFFILAFIDELLNNKGFQGKLKSFFGWIALISWLVLGGAIFTLQYVGVYVVYICVPVGLLSSFLFLIFYKLEKRVQGDSE